MYMQGLHTMLCTVSTMLNIVHSKVLLKMSTIIMKSTKVQTLGTIWPKYWECLDSKHLCMHMY